MGLLYDLMQGQSDIRFTDSDTANTEDNNTNTDVFSNTTETVIEAEIEMILNH